MNNQPLPAPEPLPTPEHCRDTTPRRVGLLQRLLLRSPFWTRSIWHRLTRMTLLTYLGILLMLLALENWFLFHPDSAPLTWMTPPAGAPVEDIQFQAVDGTPLHAWWLKPKGWNP